MFEADVQTTADISLIAPLEDNCKLLGCLLDDCVRLESGALSRQPARNL